MIKLLLTWHNKTIDGGFKKLFHNHIINVYLFSVCICYLHSHTNIQTHLADWLKYHLSILLNDSICNLLCLDMNSRMFSMLFSGGITLRIKRLKHFHIFANENILVLQCLDIWYQKGIYQQTKNMILWRWYVPLIFVKLFQQKRET